MIPALETGWLWGLVGDDAAAALWAPDRQMRAMLAVEAALTRAFGQTGHGDGATCDALAARIAAFTPDMAAITAAVGRDGIPVAELVRQLRAMAGEDAALVHSGATSQDVVDTATVLILRDVSDLLAARLAGIVAQLNTLEARFGAASLTGRTRMQAAIAMQTRDRIAPWRIAIEEHHRALTALRPEVERLQLGGAVGNRAAYGEAAPVIAAAMAQDLRLANPDRAWHVTRAPLVSYGARLAMITGSLGKIGQDVALMTQQGIATLAMSGGGGSSAMPHKQNPVLAELLVTLARFNADMSGTLQHAMIHEQERSGAAWTLEWLVLPQICMTTARALSAGETLLGQVTRIGDP